MSQINKYQAQISCDKKTHDLGKVYMVFLKAISIQKVSELV